jgi:hypothetical protein
LPFQNGKPAGALEEVVAGWALGPDARERAEHHVAGIGAAVICAKLAALGYLPWPQCWFRNLTGLPCPSCGCTRSLLASADLDLAAALKFNPLFFLSCVALPLWTTVAALDALIGRRWMDTIKARVARWPVGRVIIAALALNWLYLCLTLPK